MIDTLVLLAQGIDPETGEVFEGDSPYQRPAIIRALYQAVRELENPTEARASRVKPELPPLDERGTRLYESLRKWRSGVASAQRLPAYTVLSNRALVTIAASRPEDEPGLLACHGVGPATLEKYGSDLIALVSASSDSDGIR